MSWQCDTCHSRYETESQAARCEQRHKEVSERLRAYQDALAARTPLFGKYMKGPDGQYRLYAVIAVLGKADDVRGRRAENEIRYRMTDAVSAFEDYLPDVGGPHNKYLSIQEAVEAGWCPFFSQHYHATFPLSLRELIADAFLSLPEAQRAAHLLGRRVMSRNREC